MICSFECLRIECFHSRGQHLCKFAGTKESVCIRKDFNSHRIGLGHQHGPLFIVLGHQYGRCDVMWIGSIVQVSFWSNNTGNHSKLVISDKTQLSGSLPPGGIMATLNRFS